jgi:hypothetical protein
MKQIVLTTGASSGFGLLTARALADAGHTVYASMRDIAGRNAANAQPVLDEAKQRKVDLRVVELDVTDEASAEAAVKAIVDRDGRLDVLVHNAGHMVFGPAEAFTADQYAQLYNVAMDSLAVSYAGELTRWGIETSIMVPGAFTKGTNHFAHSGKPADEARSAEYLEGPYAGMPDTILKGLAALEPANADAGEVATKIVEVVNLPFGKRPFRVHVDPSQDGAEILNGVADRVRRELFFRAGIDDLLAPRLG